MTEPETPKRWKRWLKRALLAFLVLLIVALILHQVWNYRAGKVLQRELDAIRAAGDPVTLDELWPPEIEPKSENAALIYQEAFDLLKKSGFDQFHASLQEASALADPADWSEEATGTVREMLAKCAEPLELLRQATRMERCRFEPDRTSPAIVSLEHLSDLRQVSRLVRWSALLRLRDGDVDGALEDSRTGLLVSQVLASEPVLISFMVHLALVSQSLDSADLILSEHQPGPEICRAFIQDLKTVGDSLRRGLSRAFKGERVVTRRSLVDMTPQSSALRWLTRPIMRRVAASCLKEMQPLVELGRKPYPEARSEMDRLAALADELGKREFKDPGEVLAIMSAPVFVRIKEDATKAEARIALAQVALALKLYKADHGRYPEALDALAPEFLDRVPLDPFTAQPLKYARDDGGFFVYSVGLNGVDDDGLTEFEQEGETIEPGTDDIAWWCTR